MSARADVLLWAQRVLGRRGATACQILELAPGAGPQAAQEAFHKIARMAHPDLHRGQLTAEELEQVTTAYARAAAAYQELRGPRGTSRIGAEAQIDPVREPAPARGQTTRSIPASPPPHKAVAGPAADEPLGPAQAMNAKALIHYRKAELCLRRGDLTGAVLQLKMAIASDPQSQFLRSALAEVAAEVAEVRKKP
jgi:hypothetical protein